VPTRAVRIVNQSSYHSAKIDESIALIGRAVARQLRDVARAWGEYVWQVVDDARAQGFEVVLFDDSDAAGACGYHDLGPDGKPYARVFVRTILEHGGTWLRGANAVSTTVSHEICELVGDPTANHWVEKNSGTLIAAELCDPVEANAYTISVGNRNVSVSDFVLPDWFNPFAAKNARLDFLGVLHEPFTSAPDGYTLLHTRTGVRTVWGRKYPRWRRAAKRRPGSRTYTRVRLG
jgi:hypothetical protein